MNTDLAGKNEKSYKQKRSQNQNKEKNTAKANR